MSTPISKKFKSIREAEGLNQKEFAERCGLNYGTLRNYEAEVRQPNLDAIMSVCAAFPHYTLYLMHDKMPVTTTDDQITPQEKTLRDLPIAEKNA